MTRSPGRPDPAAADDLSLLEKAALLSGQDTWKSRAIPRIGLRSFFMSDGPHGLRKQAGAGDHLGINASIPSTCFPPAATISNSWDPTLGERIGQALGREAALIGVDVVLGPGLNIKRSPLGGRNFEYLSEDPYLSGKLAAGYVRGIQSAGVAACPKHFAVNSQETRRMASDSIVDQKTMREIYLTGFEIVVRESAPLTIMSSYNLVNGTYTSEHPQLLTQILREEWGFDGAVITDWGGGNDQVAAIAAGGTLQMPSPGFDTVNQIINAANLDQAALNARVAEVITLANRIQPVSVTDEIYPVHNRLAQEAAEQSLVLLKNDDSLLPLAAGTTVAAIGDFAFTPRYQGAGSSLVNATEVVTALDALSDSGLEVVAAARGFERGAAPNSTLIAEAVQAAGLAQAVLLYLGLEEVAESEGKDRDHMRISQAQQQTLEAVAAVNPNVVVVLSAGAAVEMPWLGKAKALVHAYLGGQAGARAVVRALLGEVNPAGRLAETYPLSLDDTPTAGNFPETKQLALYREGPFVGYRYYQTAGVPVLFPFGYGLSYTSFEYSGLTADRHGVTFTVTNTGDVAGADVPQVYVTAPAAADALGPRPIVELKGFQKLQLAPGESRQVTIALDEYAFRAYDPTAERWITVAGDYEISVGHNVADRPLQATVTLAGETPAPRPGLAQLTHYATADVHAVTDEEFATLLGTPLPRHSMAGEPLGHNSPLCELEHARSWIGRTVYKQYFQRSLRKAEESGVPDLNLLFQYGMPFRSIANMSGGMADTAMVDGVLTLVNGRPLSGLSQVLGGYFGNRKRQKNLQEEFDRVSGAASSTTE